MQHVKKDIIGIINIQEYVQNFNQKEHIMTKKKIHMKNVMITVFHVMNMEMMKIINVQNVFQVIILYLISQKVIAFLKKIKILIALIAI